MRVVGKPVATTPESIRAVMRRGEREPDCVGVIAWMHTFSPAKMWISGLAALQRPFLHLHTQYNRDLPWAEIDMDFMNLNQSAHGDREFAFMETRMGLVRKTVVGHWTRAAACASGSAPGRAPPCGWREAHSAHGRAVRRQHAPGRGHRGRQGRGAAPARRDSVYGLRRRRPRRVGERGRRTPRSTGWSASTRRRTTSPRSFAPAASGASRSATRRGSRPGCAGSSTRLGARAFTDTFEDLHGLKQLPGHRRPAADGRRLRLRRRGRLEDGGARAGR